MTSAIEIKTKLYKIMITVIIIITVWTKVCERVSSHFVNDKFSNQLFYQLPKPNFRKTPTECRRLRDSLLAKRSNATFVSNYQLL